MAVAEMRSGVSTRRSRMEPLRPLVSTSTRLASIMRALFLSMASAMTSKRAFFCVVESCAMFEAAARARASFSCVVRATAGVDAISVSSLRREVSADLAPQGKFKRAGVAAIDDGYMHAGFAGHFRRADLRSHSARTQLAVAV